MQEAAGSNPVAPILYSNRKWLNPGWFSLLILLTNDDGIDSRGFTLLKERLSIRHDVLAIAPEKERTCVGHAITLHKPLRIKKIDEALFSTNGTPADCVLLGTKVLMKKMPDLVISGINRGPNMGQDVNYSGTVAAAKEGAFLGINSIAVSIDARQDYLFEDAVETISSVIEKSVDIEMPSGILLNINIPNIKRERLKGFMVTRLGKRIYNGTITERIDPRGNKYYWIGGSGDNFERTEGTDLYAVENGYVSITPLGLNMTHNEYLNVLRDHFKAVDRT